MILKGNQRGGGQQLAVHLLNSFDNERVEVAEVRGAVARDLPGVFNEWYAHSRATKCRKYLYSLSLNPDQKQGHLTREQYLELLDRTERSLNLIGQPRAVIFHEKPDKDGVPREHCHAVWSRIDTNQEKVKAVQIAHDRLKLRTVARDFARDHGLELPDGMKPKPSKDRDKFNARAKQENLAERQQKERSGIDKAQRQADIATCWKETGNGAAFVQALQSKGYYLAHGDQRGYVVVDLRGDVHSLSRQLSDAGVAKAKDMYARLIDFPADKLVGVEAMQAEVEKIVQHAKEKEIEKSRDEDHRELQKEKEHDREEKLKERHALLYKWQWKREQELEKVVFKLLSGHLSERSALKELHEAENTGIVSARLARQPKGLLGFLSRITGVQAIVERRQQKQDIEREGRQKEQMQTLQRKHDRELHEIDRRRDALKALAARENRSAETALHRAEFQRLAQKVVEIRKPLKPEFERAAQPPVLQRTGTDDGRAPQQQASRADGAAGKSEKGKLTSFFNRIKEALHPPEPAPQPPAVPVKDDFEKAAKPPIDLTEEFNREVEYRRSQEERDRDYDGPDRDFDPSDPNR